MQLWRVSSSEFQLRTSQGNFITCDIIDGNVTATASTPSSTETFYIERNEINRVHIKHISGTYLQVDCHPNKFQQFSLIGQFLSILFVFRLQLQMT